MIVRSQDGGTVLDTESVAAFIIQGESIYAHLKASSIMPRMFEESYPLVPVKISADDRLHQFYRAWATSDSSYAPQIRSVSFQF